jgi:hypothetical protein
MGIGARRLVAAGTATALAVALPLSALASGIPVAPASGLPAAPPVTPPSLVAPQPLGNLDPARPVVAFSGSLGAAPIVDNPVPLVCAVGCDEYTFRVPAAGPKPLAPFLVAVKSTVTGPGGTFNADEGFDLYVYGPDRRLAAAANGLGANGQSTAVTAPVAGAYTVVVTYTYAYDPNAGFNGEVRLMAGSSWAPLAPTCGLTVSGVTGCFELPRLRAQPAYALTTGGIPPIASSPLGFPVPVALPLPTSCYADETIGLDNLNVTGLSDPTLRCLRFTTDIMNIGAGPLTAEIPALATGANGQLQVGYLPGECQATQLVTRADGKVVGRPAGGCEFHLEHAHYHYGDLLAYSLYRAGPGLTLGPVVASSHKESFCLSDDDYFGFGAATVNGPRRNVGQPDCNLPRELSVPVPGQPGTGTSVEEGVTPGWGDVYTWDTPDQYIDVTHVPSGTYDLVEETNPSGQLLVAGPARTCALTELRLTAGLLSDTVEALASAASIPCP